MYLSFLLVSVQMLRAAELFKDCGCDSVPVNPGTQSPQYCPIDRRPIEACDTSLLREDGCSLSCTGGARVQLAYKVNKPSIVLGTSIKCDNGTYKDQDGKTLLKLKYPTCAKKTDCSSCPSLDSTACVGTDQRTCAALSSITGSDGCTQLRCNASGAILQFYDTNKTPANLSFHVARLYCTANTKWANYSNDGQQNTAAEVPDGYTASCLAPVTTTTSTTLATTTITDIYLKYCNCPIRPLYINGSDFSKLSGKSNQDVKNSCGLQCADGYTLVVQDPTEGSLWFTADLISCGEGDWIADKPSADKPTQLHGPPLVSCLIQNECDCHYELDSRSTYNVLIDPPSDGKLCVLTCQQGAMEVDNSKSKATYAGGIYCASNTQFQDDWKGIDGSGGTVDLGNDARIKCV